MAKKKSTKAKPTGDLERLAQGEAAWLLGRPTSWLRDRADLDGRRPDGKYNAARLVAAVILDAQSKLTPIELPDGELEPIVQIAELTADSLGESLPAAIRSMEAVLARYGPAGLAAVAAAILTEWRTMRDLCVLETPETSDSIRAAAESAAEIRINNLANDTARRELRAVHVCVHCKHFRCGRQWHDGKQPKGVSTVDSICPTCAASP